MAEEFVVMSGDELFDDIDQIIGEIDEILGEEIDDEVAVTVTLPDQFTKKAERIDNILFPALKEAQKAFNDAKAAGMDKESMVGLHRARSAAFGRIIEDFQWILRNYTSILGEPKKELIIDALIWAKTHPFYPEAKGYLTQKRLKDKAQWLR